jgi:iron(III) transport system permease protein
MRSRRPWVAVRWGLLSVTLSVVIGYPVIRLGVEVLTNFADIGASLVHHASIRAFANTAVVAAATAVTSLLIGTAGAVVAQRTGSRSLAAAMISPILIPPFVSALSWVDAYAGGGLTDDLFGVRWARLFGPIGVTLSIAVNAAPVVFLIVSGSLAAHRESDLVEAARASGASAVVALRSVTLPLIRRALVGSGAVVVVLAANAYGVPAVLGLPAGFDTITTLIHRELAFSADAAAFNRAVALSMVLMILAAALATRVERPTARTPVPVGGLAPHRVHSRHRRSAALLWGYWTAAVLVPLVALVLRAIVRAPGLDPIPAHWTLDHFRTAWTSLAVEAATNSVLLAVAAASLCVLLGGALVTVRTTRLGRYFETVPLASFAVPGSALAVAALLAYSPRLRDTIALVLIVYVGKFWALAHRPLAGAVDRIPVETRLAARASGANEREVLLRIVGPMLRPAVTGAWVLVFLFAVHELTMSVLLFGPGSETLATVTLNLRQLGDSAATSALAVTMTVGVVALGAPLFFGWKTRRRVVTTP